MFDGRVYDDSGNVVLSISDFPNIGRIAKGTLSFSDTVGTRDGLYDTYRERRPTVGEISFPAVGSPPLLFVRWTDAFDGGVYFCGYRKDSSGSFVGAYIGVGSNQSYVDYVDSAGEEYFVPQPYPNPAEIEWAVCVPDPGFTGGSDYGITLYGRDGGVIFTSTSDKIPLVVDSHERDGPKGPTWMLLNGVGGSYQIYADSNWRRTRVMVRLPVARKHQWVRFKEMDDAGTYAEVFGPYATGIQTVYEYRERNEFNIFDLLKGLLRGELATELEQSSSFNTESLDETGTRHRRPPPFRFLDD